MRKSSSDLKVSKDDHTIGDPDRLVTLIEYADYRCPFSAAAFPAIEETLADLSDDVLFVYRHFPLVQLHPGAFELAQFAEAAGRQGYFWEAHELLFGEQGQIDDRKLRGFVSMYEIDKNRFIEDLQSEAVKAKVIHDMATGKELGVRKTPSFILNGELFQDEWHQSGLRDQILERLDL